MGRRKARGDRWELVRPDSPDPEPERSLPPGEQRLRIGLEKRGNGKAVTVVSGLILTRDELRALAAGLKAACGSGGKCGDGTVEVQGDHRDRARGFLAERGYRVR